MTLLRSIAGVAACVLLAGCSMVEVLLNDPTREEEVYLSKGDDESPKAMTFNQTADRRNVIFSLDEKGNLITCAEQPPDIAIASKVTEKLIVESGATGVPAGEVGASVEETLMLLVKRTTDLEMLRVSLFNNCLALANGYIDREQFYQLHRLLMEAVATQIKTNAPAANASSPES